MRRSAGNRLAGIKIQGICMRRIRFVAGASLGAVALVATSLAAAASPAAPARSAATDRAAQPQGNGEYVVSYQGDAAAVTAAVTAAGG
jgi:hypothetical protein